jgi:Ca2+-binding RTX toxin-like protein
MKKRNKFHLGLASATLAVAAIAGLSMSPAGALLAPGTPAKDVHVGLDNDNADNPFIQPPGVTAKQHMDNTDVLVGRANHDLLIGKLGGDTLLGNQGSDIMIGGPEGGS